MVRHVCSSTTNMFRILKNKLIQYWLLLHLPRLGDDSASIFFEMESKFWKKKKKTFFSPFASLTFERESRRRLLLWIEKNIEKPISWFKCGTRQLEVDVEALLSEARESVCVRESERERVCVRESEREREYLSNIKNGYETFHQLSFLAASPNFMFCCWRE